MTRASTAFKGEGLLLGYQAWVGRWVGLGTEVEKAEGSQEPGRSEFRGGGHKQLLGAVAL